MMMNMMMIKIIIDIIIKRVEMIMKRMIMILEIIINNDVGQSDRREEERIEIKSWR